MTKRKRTKKAAPAKAAPNAKMITLVKLPKAGELKGHALVIVETLQANKKRMTVPELLAALEGKVVTKNVLGMRDVWHMTRPRLLAAGYIKEGK